MGEEHHDEHIDLIERSTGDDTIDLGYSAVAQSDNQARNEAPPSAPRGGSSTASPVNSTTPPAEHKDQKQTR